MSKLVVYAVSYFDGEEATGAVWEDMDKAKAFLEDKVSLLSVDKEFQPLAAEIEDGNWEGENICIQGVPESGAGGVGVVTAIRANLRLG